MGEGNRRKVPKELKEWEREKRLIPEMIRMHCHAKQHTKGQDLCPECKELLDYALFRLEKCPFKENKTFCSFCKVHCYRPEMRERIREVMRWSGPRLTFTHPAYAFRHVFQMIAYKRRLKKEGGA